MRRLQQWVAQVMNVMLFLFVAAVVVIAGGAGPASAQDGLRFGIWYPYEGVYGVPPIDAFAARGIEASFITGNIDAATLANYDVIFFGRGGMIGFYPTGAGVITDMDALINWIAAGGGVIGESNAFIYDSNAWRGTDWSSRLSVVAGITGPNAGYDTAGYNLPVTIVLTDHPIALGVPASFNLNGPDANMYSTFLDIIKNPTAVTVGTVGYAGSEAPIVAALYGLGRSVYFPTAVGFGGMDWSLNQNYEVLFLNAVQWAAEGRRLKVTIDIKPGSDPNCFNNNEAGVLPVAILGAADLAVRDIDPASLSLEGLAVKVVGKNSRLLSHYEDVNMDGREDLVVQFEDSDMVFAPGDTMADVTGKLYNGRPIVGSDSICIVP